MLTEMLLPRIARHWPVCVISTRGQARKARIDNFELEQLEFINLSSKMMGNFIHRDIHMGIHTSMHAVTYSHTCSHTLPTYLATQQTNG